MICRDLMQLTCLSDRENVMSTTMKALTSMSKSRFWEAGDFCHPVRVANRSVSPSHIQWSDHQARHARMEIPEGKSLASNTIFGVCNHENFDTKDLYLLQD